MSRRASVAVCFGFVLAGAAVALASGAAQSDNARVVQATPLAPGPAEYATLGMIAADAPVTVLERSQGWVRVRVEGWIPADALGAVAPAGSTAPAGTSSPSAATTPPAATAPTGSPGPAGASVSGVVSGDRTWLEGTLEIQQAGWLRKKKLTGVGRQVWLLSSGFDLESAGATTPQEREQIAALDAEAERLTNEASKAMHGSSFTDSTRRHDELIRQRDQALAKRNAILGQQHGRREAAARQSALASATCDARGYFAFPAARPGSYRVYARLVEGDVDLEWIEDVEVGAAGTRIALDETHARDLPGKP